MKAKTQFLKMFYKLPEKARRELVYDFTNNPMTLNVLSCEIGNNTKLGDEILNRLGYEDKPTNKEDSK